MASFGLGDIATCIMVAQRLYAIHKTDPQKQYSDFATEIHDLEQNLEKLLSVASNAAPATELLLSDMPSAINPSAMERWQPKSLEILTGDFRKTLQSCEKLLNDGRSYEGPASYVAKIRYALAVEEPMRLLSERLRLHSLKISLVLQPLKLSLQAEIRQRIRHVEDTTEDIRDTTEQILNLLLNRDRQLERLPRLPNGQPLAELADTSGANGHVEQPRAVLEIPLRLLDKLEAAFESSDDVPRNQRDIALYKVINGFLYHFARGTANFQADDLASTSALRDRYMDLMKSIFLLAKIKICREYQEKVRDDSLWKHYVRSLEKMCLNEQRRFIIPDIPQSMERPDIELLVNLQKSEYLLHLKDNDYENELVPGIENLKIIYHVQLQSPRPKEEDHELTLLRLSESKLGIQYVKTQKDDSRNRDRTKSAVNLREACLKPIWMDQFDRQVLTATFVDDYGVPIVLEFFKKMDMWRFQQALTSFEVAHDELGVTVQQVFSRHHTIAATGAVQMWQEDKLDAEDLHPQPTPPVLSTAPTLLPGPKLADGQRSSTFLTTSSTFSEKKYHRRTSQGSLTPSNRTVLSSASTTTSALRMLPPIAPMIVFLLTSEGDRKRSFLTMTLTKDVCAKKGCHCKADFAKCPHLNIEPKTRSTPLIVHRLTAGPGADNDVPNIAALGLYQNNPKWTPAGLQRVEGLEHLKIEFSTAAQKWSFVNAMWRELDIFMNKSAIQKREDTVRRNAHVSSFAQQS